MQTEGRAEYTRKKILYIIQNRCVVYLKELHVTVYKTKPVRSSIDTGSIQILNSTVVCKCKQPLKKGYSPTALKMIVS